jgi:hypothetical protein
MLPAIEIERRTLRLQSNCAAWLGTYDFHPHRIGILIDERLQTCAFRFMQNRRAARVLAQHPAHDGNKVAPCRMTGIPTMLEGVSRAVQRAPPHTRALTHRSHIVLKASQCSLRLARLPGARILRLYANLHRVKERNVSQ